MDQIYSQAGLAIGQCFSMSSVISQSQFVVQAEVEMSVLWFSAQSPLIQTQACVFAYHLGHLCTGSPGGLRKMPPAGQLGYLPLRERPKKC